MSLGASIEVPYFVLSLWLGDQVDRRPRKVLMVGADLLRAVCFVVVAWLAATEISSLWPYMIVGFVVGCGSVAFSVAGFANCPS